MKRWLFLLFLFILLPASAVLAQVTVTGTVVDEQKEPLIGVSVSIKGTTTGVTTDLDGKYSITVPDKSVITFEYLGMESKNFTITPSVTKLDVELKSDAHVIDEVVVTAMGIKAEKRKLNFAVSSVNAEDLMASKANNFVEALQGRVAGLNVTTQGGSPNASAQMQIRAAASMSTTQDNGPLFVIDGMSMAAGATAMAQLNPGDIENVTVLKGAAASALYGSRGANGVVMVTTRTGKKGKTSVSFSNSFQIANAARVPEIQGVWVPGGNGITTNKYGVGGWGAEVGEGTETYNNLKNFFKTGFLHKHDVSVTASGENISTFASMNYSNQTGIVPEDRLEKLGMYLKTTFDVSPTFSMSFMANMYSTKSRDAAQSYETTFPEYMKDVYNWPINNNMEDYSTPNGGISWLYDNNGEPDGFYAYDKDSYMGTWPVNPYVRRYMDNAQREGTNNIAQLITTWKAFKNFEWITRIGLEYSNSLYKGYTVPRFYLDEHEDYKPKVVGKEEMAKLGSYDATTSRVNNYTFNSLARYNYQLSRDFTFEFMLGAEGWIYKGYSTHEGGRVFDLRNFYHISNLKDVTPKDQDLNIRRSRKTGFFGEIRGDYKGIASLSVTGRDDGASRLYESLSGFSYFYPSVTAGITFSELLKLSGNTFSFGKIRANWAKVGKDPSTSYLFGRKYTQQPTFPGSGYTVNPSLTIATKDLKPEMMKSWEVGLDVRFFNNSARLDVAYYSTSVDDQIVTARVSPTSGNIQETTNQGDITNHGIEATLEYDVVRNKDLTWTAFANFAMNRSKVNRMAPGLDVVPNQSTQVGQYLQTAAYLGRSITAIMGGDYNRTEDGTIICNEDGTPQFAASTTVYLGDREPDFRVGFGSNLTYKNWSFSFLVDARKGGDVVNATAYQSLYANGMAKRLEEYRNREVVFNGVVKQADGTYVKNTTPVILTPRNITNYIMPGTSNFIEDVSFVRLSYVTVGYSFRNFLKKEGILKDLNLSITGQNLLLLTNYSGADPQVNFNSSGGSGSTGWDYFSIPNTRNFNLTINATF